MKPKKDVYVSITIAAAAVGFCSFLALFLCLFQSLRTKEILIREKQSPLYLIDGIAVDSKGTLFVCSTTGQAIEAFDNTGGFLYEYKLPSNGGDIQFYIDEQDVLHVLLVRGPSQKRMIQLKDGQILSQEPWRSSELVKAVPGGLFSGTQTYHDAAGQTYEVHFNYVNLFDGQGTFLRRIRFKAPIWPLPFAFYFCITAACELILITAFLCKYYPNKKPPQKKRSLLRRFFLRGF